MSKNLLTAVGTLCILSAWAYQGGLCITKCLDLMYLPMFSKQRDSRSTNRDGFSWSVYIPDSETNLSITREIRVLDWQLKPLIPTAKRKIFMLNFDPLSTDWIKYKNDLCHSVLVLLEPCQLLCLTNNNECLCVMVLWHILCLCCGLKIFFRRIDNFY